MVLGTLEKQLIFSAPFSGKHHCNSAVGMEGPMLTKLVCSMTRKYLVSLVMEAARLSGGGHVMAAWEAKMSTFPTSLSVGGEEALKSPSTPGKPPHGGGKIRGDGSLGWRRDGTLTFSTASSSRRKCVCASAQPTSHRPNVATLGNTQGQACALCWRKTLCAGGTLECIGLPPSLVNMSSSTMSRTSTSRGRPIYPAVETHPQPLSSTSTTLLSSISGQQQLLQRVPSPLTAHGAEHPALH